MVIRYERAGQPHEHRVVFPAEITDFRYGRWLGQRGIAVVGSTGAREFYYVTLDFTGQRTPGEPLPVAPLRVPAPAGPYRLLGIASTGGDSIVITAVRHLRPDLRRNRLTGWMFIDNCPPYGASGAEPGAVIPFDISAPPEEAERSEPGQEVEKEAAAGRRPEPGVSVTTSGQGGTFCDSPPLSRSAIPVDQGGAR